MLKKVKKTSAYYKVTDSGYQQVQMLESLNIFNMSQKPIKLINVSIRCNQIFKENKKYKENIDQNRRTYNGSELVYQDAMKYNELIKLQIKQTNQENIQENESRPLQDSEIFVLKQITHNNIIMNRSQFLIPLTKQRTQKKHRRNKIQQFLQKVHHRQIQTVKSIIISAPEQGYNSIFDINKRQNPFTSCKNLQNSIHIRQNQSQNIQQSQQNSEQNQNYESQLQKSKSFIRQYERQQNQRLTLN